MIKFYRTTNGSIKEISRRKLAKNCWIDVISPTDNELKDLAKITKIPVEDLKMPLDEEERPRIDQTKNSTMIIFRSPFIKDENEIETSPIGFFLTKKYIVTIHLYFTGYVRPLFEQGKTAQKTNTPSDILVHFITEITKGYFQVLRRFEKQIDIVEDSVIKEPDKVSIEKIADIKKTLIYFHRSLVANRVVLQHITERPILFIDVKLKEYFHDLHTETFQLLEMTGTYRDILSGTMDTYSYTISNSLNIVMKTLTLIMALLMVPALIAGMYGMNVSLPLAEHPFAFFVVIITMLTAMILIYFFFKLKKWI